MSFEKQVKKTAFCLIAMLIALLGHAQSPAFHFFDQTKLADIQGRVSSISYEEVYEDRPPFLMLTLRAEDQRSFRVEVCPQWYFASDIAVGMKMTVRGSLQESAERGLYMIAQEMIFQGEKLTLRDSKGFPLWSRGGRGASRKHTGTSGRGRK
jgi:hypothetical protein